VTDLDRLLDFAARSRLPGGGFGYLGSDGRVLADRPVETLIVARMTHVFGLAQLLGHPKADELVRHGVAALTDGPLRDAERGGWNASTDDDTKAAYVHAFVVLAGSTAATAGIEGGRALLEDAVEVWQGRFWDDDQGLAADEWDGGWTRLADYRGANANMHGVEATLAAADALEPTATAGRLRDQAVRSIQRIVNGFARERDWRLPEHFTADWTPMPEYNRDRPADPFKPYGVTVGHQFEWARLALHARAALPEPPPWLLDDAGMAVEEWDASWSRLDDYRGLNANMNGVEATLAAADALPVADQGGKARLRRQALRTTERVMTEWGRQFRWRLPEHFTTAWTPLPEYNRERPADPFRPYGVTVGHLFEWARLAMHVRAVTSRPPSWLRDGARNLFTVASGRWAADGHPGLPYTLDWEDRVVVGARMHWVLCEAIAAASVLAEALEDDGYRGLAARWREHGERAFADPATGSWHHELTPDGDVGTGTWAGQPDAYHLAQMLLLDGRPVRGSVAATLG